MNDEQKNILIFYLQRWLVRRKGCHVQEPKKDKESKVLLHSLTKMKRLLLARKVGRFKGMDA